MDRLHYFRLIPELKAICFNEVVLQNEEICCNSYYMYKHVDVCHDIAGSKK